MIAIFYIISPLLIVLDKNRIIYYLLPVFIIVSLIVQRGSVPQDFVHFFSVYVLGMIFSKYKEILIPLTRKYFILLAALFSFLIIFEYSIYTQRELFNYVSKMLGCCLLLPILYKYDTILKKRFNYLALISFGIYFVHSYMISSIKLLSSGKIGGTLALHPSVLTFLSFFIAITILCSLLIMLSKKIFGKYSRLIIGC